MGKVKYSYASSFVVVPEKLRVLLRDVLAADSGLEETVELVDELHRELDHFTTDLRDELAGKREADAREARRVARRAEALAARQRAA